MLHFEVSNSRLNPTIDESSVEKICTVINDGARLYKGCVPPEALREPFVSEAYIKNEVKTGVIFLTAIHKDKAVGVMGYQEFSNAFLVRHAYVCLAFQRMGVGQMLLDDVLGHSNNRPVYLGCFTRAIWALNFYKKNGFRVLNQSKAAALRATYWNYDDNHLKHTVVLELDKNRRCYIKEDNMKGPDEIQ